MTHSLILGLVLTLGVTVMVVMVAGDSVIQTGVGIEVGA